MGGRKVERGWKEGGKVGGRKEAWKGCGVASWDCRAASMGLQAWSAPGPHSSGCKSNSKSFAGGKFAFRLSPPAPSAARRAGGRPGLEWPKPVEVSGSEKAASPRI